MSDYNRPKLFEALKYGGKCVVCEDEIEKGVPGWVFRGRCACATHRTDSVIDAVGELPDDRPSWTRDPPVQPTSEALKGLDESLARIAHLLEMMYKDKGTPK